jgi:hypothetical protein
VTSFPDATWLIQARNSFSRADSVAAAFAMDPHGIVELRSPLSD